MHCGWRVVDIYFQMKLYQGLESWEMWSEGWLGFNGFLWGIPAGSRCDLHHSRLLTHSFPQLCSSFMSSNLSVALTVVRVTLCNSNTMNSYLVHLYFRGASVLIKQINNNSKEWHPMVLTQQINVKMEDNRSMCHYFHKRNNNWQFYWSSNKKGQQSGI